MLEKSQSFFVTFCGSHEGDLKTHYLRNLIEVDLGKDNLLGDTQGIVSFSVEFGTDAFEVADPWKSY